MKKAILITLAVVILLLVSGLFFGSRFFNNLWFGTPPSKFSLETDFQPLQMQWGEETYGDYVEKHNIIKVPVRLAILPSHSFYFQLDTGAPTSMVYGNPLKVLREAGFEAARDTVDRQTYLSIMEILSGDSKIKLGMMVIRSDYGTAFQLDDTTSEVNLGTLGADFFGQYLTEIDFKNLKLQFYKKPETWMTSANDFQPFGFKGRRFMLPCVINKKKYELFYDSGSSAFGLVTTKGRYEAYSDEFSPEISYEAGSWGNSIPIKHKETQQSMRMGGLELPLRRVSYIDMYSNLQGVISPFTPIGGWLGNKAFLDRSLIFDAPNEKFVIVRK